MTQKGVALVTGLLILAAVSLIAITAAGSMTLQRKQAANYQDKSVAMANAELAGSWAKAWLYSRLDIDRQPSCTQNCLLPVAVHLPGELPEGLENHSLQWWRDMAVDAGRNPASGEQHLEARTGSFWAMEEIHFLEHEETDELSNPSGVGFYRVYSYGAGKHPRSTVVTESIVARPWQGAYSPLDFPPGQPLATFCRQFPPELACGTVAWRQLK